MVWEARISSIEERGPHCRGKGPWPPLEWLPLGGSTCAVPSMYRRIPSAHAPCNAVLKVVLNVLKETHCTIPPSQVVY